MEEVIRIRCVKNGEMQQLALKIGKLYDAIESPTIKGAYQVLIDDSGRKNVNFSKDWFEKVNERVKDESECLYKENKTYLERIEALNGELAAKELHWQNYLLEIKSEYDNLIIRLEKTVKSLEKELEEYKNANEVIPVLETEIEKLKDEIKTNNCERYELFLKAAAYEGREKMIKALKTFVECL